MGVGQSATLIVMLRDEIKPFTDGNGLIAPNLVPLGETRGSDNGPMFTSEYVIMLKLRGELTRQDIDDFREKVGACFLIPGLLSRAPGDKGQTGPDDYYGVLAACQVLEIRDWPTQMVQWGRDHLGCFNNESPGSFSWASFLIRQPQLIACGYAASNKTSLTTWPVFFYTALVILTSCINTPSSNTDARRLSWLLIQCCAPVSVMCRLAAFFWFKRLAADYPAGTKGCYMRQVALIYYKDNHPFQKYWIDP